MLVILFLGIALLQLALFIIGLFAGVKFIDFGLHYLADSGAPEFWSPDSFWAWVAGIVLMLLAVVFLRKVADFVRTLINLLPNILYRVLLATGKQVVAIILMVLYFLTFFVVSILVALWVTSAFFDYTTANHQHLTTFFQHGNTWAYFATFCLVHYILFPARNKDKEQSDET